jgi:NADPH-dependent 2,4-dienoyl-CoA reductase/sulfur reductase-like enzyme
MTPGRVKYLLIGGALSVSEAAQSIRTRDGSGQMMLVTRESARPYRRFELARGYLRREIDRDAVSALPGSWFSVHNVMLRTGRRVATLDVARHALTLDNNEQISYDRLLIASGAVSRPLTVPGANLPGNYPLWTLDDADRIRNAIDVARTDGRPHATVDPIVGRRLNGRVAVIGAGMLGVEVAASLRQCRLHVELIDQLQHPWPAVAGSGVGGLVARTLAGEGITFHGSAASRIEGDGRVQRVVLANNHVVECDFVVTCVGVDQNREIIRNTPLAAERTLLVDEACRTNVPDVFAAGECCSVFDSRFGKHIPVRRWEQASETGRVAGLNMAGASEKYAAVASITTEWFNQRARVWGEARFVDRRIVRQESPTRMVEIGLAADGRVSQIIATESWDEHACRQLVALRVDLRGREDEARDPGVELAALLT